MHWWENAYPHLSWLLSGSFSERNKSKDGMGSRRLLSQVLKVYNQPGKRQRQSQKFWFYTILYTWPQLVGWCLQLSTQRTSTDQLQIHRIIASIQKLSISCNWKLAASASCSRSSVAGSASRPSASRTARTGFSLCRFLPWLFHERKSHNIIQYPQSLQSLRSPGSKTFSLLLLQYTTVSWVLTTCMSW